MGAALVIGAVVGAAFGEALAILHEAVKHVVGQGRRFKSILKDLESTLKHIAPDVQKIKELNLARDRPKREIKSLIKKMEMGKELVLKCSKIKLKPWSLKNWFKACYYSKQLKKLDDAIQKYCRVALPCLIARTVLENSVKLDQITKENLVKLDKITKENSAKLDQITNIAKRTFAAVKGIRDQVNGIRDQMILLCCNEESKGDEDGKAERVLDKLMEVGKVDPMKLLRYLLKLRDMGSQKTKKDNKAEKKAEDNKPKEKTKKDNKAAKKGNKAETKAEDNKPKEKTKKDNKAEKKAEDNKPKEKTKKDNKAAKKGNKAEKKAEDNKPKEKTKKDNKAEKKAEDNKPKEKTKKDNKAAKKGNKAEKRRKPRTTNPKS